MNIAVIDKKDITIKIENSSIKIEEQTIPFKLIDMLILNHRATISTNNILKLTANNISILIISYNNEHTSIISCGSAKNSDLKLAQYNSHIRRLDFAKYFIKQKFISHLEHLKSFNVIMDIKKEMAQINDSESVDEIMGIEGSFAKIYFKHIKHFSKYHSALPSSFCLFPDCLIWFFSTIIISTLNLDT